MLVFLLFSFCFVFEISASEYGMSATVLNVLAHSIAVSLIDVMIEMFGAKAC